MRHDFPSTRDKSALRAFFLARRNAAPEEEKRENDAAIRNAAVNFLEKTSGTVAFYLPMRGEADVFDLAQRLPDRAFALPSLDEGGSPCFRLYRKDDPLVRMPGFFAPDFRAPLCVPAVALCPLVAFDEEGGRLGYGKGFYDRVLADVPDALIVGMAFESQRSPFILPREPHDVTLRGVVTERGYFASRRF